jgi:hypothetical protein
MHSAEGFLAARGDVGDVFNLTKVTGESYRIPATPPDRVNQHFQTILTPGDQNDAGSRLGEKASNRLADPRTASGDDSSSVVEIKE